MDEKPSWKKSSRGFYVFTDGHAEAPINLDYPSKRRLMPFIEPCDGGYAVSVCDGPAPFLEGAKTLAEAKKLGENPHLITLLQLKKPEWNPKRRTA